MQFNRSNRATNLELAARIYTAVMMFIYGSAKFYGGQFSTNPTVLDKALKDISGFELTWAFFGYSYPYAVIIGMTQILGGLMLLFRPIKLVGAVILFPVLVNIVLIDVLYKIPLGALANAITCLLCTALVLVNHKNTLLKLILPPRLPQERPALSFPVVFKNLLIVIALLLGISIIAWIINFLLGRILG